MPLFDPARRNAKAEPRTFGLPPEARERRLDQHAAAVASAASELAAARPKPSTRRWRAERRERREQAAGSAAVSAPAGGAAGPDVAATGLVDHRLDEALIERAEQRGSEGRKRLAQAQERAGREGRALAERCRDMGPTMASDVRASAADAVAERWAESRATRRRHPGEADGARRRLRLRSAQKTVDTGVTTVTDSLLLLLHAAPRRGGGGGRAVRVLRKRPTLQVLSRRGRERRERAAAQRQAAAERGAEAAEGGAAAQPRVDARLGSDIERRRDDAAEQAVLRRRAGRAHAAERRARDHEGRAPFARTHSQLVAGMTHHRRAVGAAKPSVDCSSGPKGAKRPRWRPALAPEGRLGAGGRFPPSQSGLIAAVQSHRRRLRAIAEREVRDTQPRGALAPVRHAWRGNRHRPPGREPLPPDPAGDVYRLHEKRVRLARKRGAKLSHGWDGGGAWMAGRNQDKWRRQRQEQRLRKEREAKTERQRVAAAERRARRPPQPQPSADAYYWDQLSD